MSNLTTNDTQLFVGIDVGSTTTKIVAINPEKHEILLSNYKRHNAAQAQSVQDALAFFEDKFPNTRIRLALTGSGAKHLAEALGCCYIQEVVANSIALQKEYDNVGTAIELGGQDAKMIFFRRDPATQTLNVADMRMNGSCAGGTGAFIDEIASILKVPVEEFNELASQGSCIYDISGRCGVYAKTDIQPLLNQGISRQDLALSSFHAIAKQTIGGLAQGLDIQKPVVFEGGPLTFNPTLVNVFAKRLGLTPEETLRPTHPEIMIAYGAALSLDGMFAGNSSWYAPKHYLELLDNPKLRAHLQASADGPRFFESEEEHRAFNERHQLPEFTPYVPKKGETVHAYLGIDSGSTTTKFVLMDENENILDSFYAPNEGDPLTVARTALLTIHDRYEKSGACLDIIAAGTTGYGELLFSKAFSTESHVVETVAHARAADQNHVLGRVQEPERGQVVHDGPGYGGLEGEVEVGQRLDEREAGGAHLAVGPAAALGLGLLGGHGQHRRGEVGLAGGHRRHPVGQPRRHGVQPQLREVLAYAGVGAALVPGAHSDPSPSLPSSSRLARAAASMSASA